MRWIFKVIVICSIFTYITVSGQTECNCDPGLPGPRGKRGKKGTQGETGLTGPQGPPGLVGLPGKEGIPGIPGLKGPHGTSGLNGSTGPPGLDGEPGPIGPPGSEGPPGIPGQSGTNGLTGPPGLNGVSGAVGPPGPPGNDGRDGQRGIQGISGNRGPPGPRGNAGVHYTRWGESTCPSTPGTELVYTGVTGGSWYSDPGGAANYICMPLDPEYTTQYRSGTQHYNKVWGTEYKDPLRNGYNNVNVPCAVCFASTQASTMMIPAKTSCPSRWRREYYGYLMSAFRGDSGRTMYECVDISLEGIPGSIADTDGAKLYHIEASCNGMPCPPYNSYKELSCVVCTR